MMEIRILQARHYVRIGAREIGDEVNVDDDYGKQLCEQNFAEEVKKSRAVPKKTAAGDDMKETEDA